MSARQMTVITSLLACCVSYLSIYSLNTLSTLIRSPGPLLVLSYTLPYSLSILYKVSTTDLINLLYITSNSYKLKLYHHITLNS